MQDGIDEPPCYCCSGKASFAELQDSKGRGIIQVYYPMTFVLAKTRIYITMSSNVFWISGDFIGIKGFVFKTQTGEISVHAQTLTLLSKV